MRGRESIAPVAVDVQENLSCDTCPLAGGCLVRLLLVDGEGGDSSGAAALLVVSAGFLRCG